MYKLRKFKFKNSIYLSDFVCYGIVQREINVCRIFLSCKENLKFMNDMNVHKTTMITTFVFFKQQKVIMFFNLSII